jgi:hypothetical protein
MEADLIIRMLATLRLRNKNIDECQQLNKEIDIHQIQHDIFYEKLRAKA